MPHKFILSIPDYVILAVILIISVSIGLYFRFVGGHQKTNEEYLFAGRDMTVFPVSISLMATFMSASNLMGVPAEMYLFGTHMFFMSIGFILGPLLAAWLFLPIYFEIGATTSYEYLEKRFGKSIRRFLSGCFLFQYTFFSAVSLYAPALALSAVTNLPIWIAILSVGTVCTFYCTFGGMKAVLWADVFQAVLMFTCVLIVIIHGTIDVGGFSNVFQIASNGGRLVIPSWTIDVKKRYTMLSIILQGLIISLGCYGCSQVQVQRLLSVKDIRRSKLATVASIPLLCGFQLACCFCGLVFYGYFHSCDPLMSEDRPIQSADQLLPLYITTALKNYPGLPGLCIAGIFSASLSTVSSAVNAMSAVIVEDFIRPVRPDYANSIIVIKVLTVLFGGLCIILSFLAGALGHLVKTTILVVAVFYAPTLAVYLLGSLSLVANEKGSILGICCGVIPTIYLTIKTSQNAYEILPFSNEYDLRNQSYASSTFVAENTSTSLLIPSNSSYLMVPSLNQTNKNSSLDLSFMWISPISFAATIIMGYISSYIIGFFQDKPQVVSPMLLSPFRRKFCAGEGGCKSKQRTAKKEDESNQQTSL